MNVLIIGSGGREHCLAWKISQSNLCDQLYIAPGNGGSENTGRNVNLSLDNFEDIGSFCLEENVSMLVVGPEQPLVNGIYDFFQQPRFEHITVIGPSKKAAQLEGSKAFAKKFMQRHNIPTASYLEINASNIKEGVHQIENSKGPYVLKADGLAAGKGVLIIESKEEAKTALQNMILNQQFGAASSSVVIESFLEGIEFSVFVLTDGTDYKILPSAKDYKRIGEGDTGLNTGGMGAISPPTFVTESLMGEVDEHIIAPTVKGLKLDKMDYRGFIFFGLIQTSEGPKVIEYNCRLGDPETQAVLPRIESDLLAAFKAIGNVSLGEYDLAISKTSRAVVVLASQGYPEAYEKGIEIQIPEMGANCKVFHAGTRKENDSLVSTGGRVLAVSAEGNNTVECVNKAYDEIKKVSFSSGYYRKDIGWEFL